MVSGSDGPASVLNKSMRESCVLIEPGLDVVNESVRRQVSRVHSGRWPVVCRGEWAPSRVQYVWGASRSGVIIIQSSAVWPAWRARGC